MSSLFDRFRRMGPQPAGIEQDRFPGAFGGQADRALRDQSTLLADVTRKQLAAVNDLTRAERALQVEIEKTNKLLSERAKLLDQQRRTGGGAPPPGLPPVGPSPGMPGAAGPAPGGALGLVGRFAPASPLLAVGGAFATISTANQVMRAGQTAGPYATDAERRQAEMFALPVLGPSIERLHQFELLRRGIPFAMQQIEREHFERSTAQELAVEAAARTVPVRARLTGAQARSEAMADLALPGVPGGPRLTAGAERLFQEEMARLPARDAQARAEAERRAQAGVAEAAEARRAAEAVRLEDMARRHADARQRFEAARQGPQALDSATALLLGRAAQEGAQKEADQARVVEEATTRAVESRLQLRERESQVRKAGIELAKAELAIAESREQRAVSDSQRLGAMSVGGREQALQAALFVKRYGLQAAGPALAGLAEQAFPDFIAKERERFGDVQARALRERALAGGLRPEDTDVGRFGVQQARAAADKARVELRAQVVLDEKETAKALAAELGPFLERLIRTFILEMEGRFQKQRAEQIAGAAAAK